MYTYVKASVVTGAALTQPTCKEDPPQQVGHLYQLMVVRDSDGQLQEDIRCCEAGLATDYSSPVLNCPSQSPINLAITSILFSHCLRWKPPIFQPTWLVRSTQSSTSAKNAALPCRVAAAPTVESVSQMGRALTVQRPWVGVSFRKS